MSQNTYDVTEWSTGDPRQDIGAVINSIITDIKSRQRTSDNHGTGKPGAVIRIPPGDYRLRTPVRIDISFLRIEGAGHGFTSSSIRFNVPPTQWGDLHELWPGGSRIMVDIPAGTSPDPQAQAAFILDRRGDPRLSSVEFMGFCLDGLHFDDDASTLPAENTYSNGKTGILGLTASDSVRINGMGFVYLEHAIAMHHADALSIHDNFVAECGSCIELLGWGQASKITDNLIGAGFKGRSIYAENHGGLLVNGNNVFPRGSSSIHLRGVHRSGVTGNRLHSFYPGMVVLDTGSSENLFAANHLLRDIEPWAPFAGITNGRSEADGLVVVDGSDNSVIGNHISIVRAGSPQGWSAADMVAIMLQSGERNYLANNHVVARDTQAEARDSCYEAQVDSLLNSSQSGEFPFTAVKVEPSCVANIILDCGTHDQIIADSQKNAIRATPKIGMLG